MRLYISDFSTNKAIDDARKAHGEMLAQPTKLAQEQKGRDLTNQLKQDNVDTFYNNLERQVTAEAISGKQECPALIQGQYIGN